VQGDVVFGHADLLRHLNYLNLNIYLDQVLRQGIHLNQTGIHSSCKATELGDQADISLSNRLVGIRTDDTAWNGAERADDITKGVYHGAVPAMLTRIFGVGLDDARVRGLKILTAWRLDLDEGVVGCSVGA